MDMFFDFLIEKLLGVAKRGYLAKILAWTGIGLLTAVSLLYSYDRLVEFVNFYFGTNL
ncbi:hypothetical protein [Phyllobacterium zundukense]|uniref:hypothetical protein n=1 Tax=Phyllobacterium zundukense TaxID=1867719 RepID=UPI0012FFE4DF|nr:hypothetical protein [Phyllobacterium zundukense]